MAMTTTTLQLEICYGTRIDAAPRFLNRMRSISSRRVGARIGSLEAKYGKVRNIAAVSRNGRKICTADELHHVPVHNSDWRLALWRYLPSSKAPARNHPLLLLSGVATNAIGYDLSPESSFARFMSNQGFDTWIVELRGAGLSAQGVEFGETEQPANTTKEQTDSTIGSAYDGVVSSKEQLIIGSSASGDSVTSSIGWKGRQIFSKPNKLLPMSNLLETFMHLSERLSAFLNGGFSEAGQNFISTSQIQELREKFINIIKGGKQTVTPPLSEWQEFLSTTVVDFQKQLDVVKYDWDFDHYLLEDVPAAMEYIRAQTKPKDGKLLAIGHSMGGILLYATLSRCYFEGRESGLASVTTLGSTLDYTSSRSSLKFLLPLAEPAQALNIPVIPVGGLIAAAHPLASYPPYVLSWLTPQISAPNMMHPELFEKLVLKNFCTVPAKLLVQLATAFRDGGLCDRSRTFFYKDHIGRGNVPILALAGDKDLICPPEAVYETVKLIPERLVTYEVLGEPGGPHYGHYDLVGGRLAVNEVYPRIVEFLHCHDQI